MSPVTPVTPSRRDHQRPTHLLRRRLQRSSDPRAADADGNGQVLHGSTPSYIAATTAFDSYGRVLAVTDALSRTTKTAYTDTKGLTTSMVTTNALHHTATTSLDPAWGVTTKSIDANGRTTTQGYDALGRLLSVYLPGRTASDGPRTCGSAMACAHRRRQLGQHREAGRQRQHDHELRAAGRAAPPSPDPGAQPHLGRGAHPDQHHL